MYHCQKQENTSDEQTKYQIRCDDKPAASSFAAANQSFQCPPVTIQVAPPSWPWQGPTSQPMARDLSSVGCSGRQLSFSGLKCWKTLLHFLDFVQQDLWRVRHKPMSTSFHSHTAEPMGSTLRQVGRLRFLCPNGARRSKARLRGTFQIYGSSSNYVATVTRAMRLLWAHLAQCETQRWYPCSAHHLPSTPVHGQ